MATVSLRQLCKAFGAQAVVHGVDLDIDDKEFLVLVGPSGCGKSGHQREHLCLSAAVAA
jgi:multiple sugar transport system ATP-binding protein